LYSSLCPLCLCGESSSPTRLTTDGDFKEKLQWSPDGSKILMTRIHEGKMGLWTMNTDGTELKRLFKHDEAPDFDGHWSPDSKRIVFVFDVLQGTDGKLHIHTINADGTDNKVLIPNKAFEESPRWSPDGKQLAFVSTRDGNQEIYVATFSPPHPGPLPPGGEGVPSSPLPSGGEGKGEGGTAKNIKRLTNELAADNNPSWSPDGKQLAFASHRHGNWEIYVMNADGANVRRLTNHPSMDYWPASSPDGKQIAFTSNRDGNYEIYVMNADGSDPRNLTRNAATDNFAAWSPDGKKLAFVSNRSGASEVYVVDVK
jgi:TolB protein